jgi:hypothetical protein
VLGLRLVAPPTIPTLRMVFFVERYSGQPLSYAVLMDDCANARIDSSVLYLRRSAGGRGGVTQTTRRLGTLNSPQEGSRARDTMLIEHDSDGVGDQS